MFQRNQNEPKKRQTTQADIKKLEESQITPVIPLLKSSMFKKQDEVSDQRQVIPGQLDLQDKE